MEDIKKEEAVIIDSLFQTVEKRRDTLFLLCQNRQSFIYTHCV